MEKISLLLLRKNIYKTFVYIFKLEINYHKIFYVNYPISC